MEIVSHPEYAQTIFVIIEWINDCSYKAIYDPSKMELDEFQEFVKSNGGIVTEFISFDTNCSDIKSTLTLEGIADIIESKICIE